LRAFKPQQRDQWARALPVELSASMEAELQAERRADRAEKERELAAKRARRDEHARREKRVERELQERVLQIVAEEKETREALSAIEVQRWNEKKASERRKKDKVLDVEVEALKAKREAQDLKMKLLHAEVKEQQASLLQRKLEREKNAFSAEDEPVVLHEYHHVHVHHYHDVDDEGRPQPAFGGEVDGTVESPASTVRMHETSRTETKEVISGMKLPPPSELRGLTRARASREAAVRGRQQLHAPDARLAQASAAYTRAHP